MRDGPDIARLAALIGDPARASMLVLLMDGRALTATELAHAAGVSAPTASSHLGKLEEGGVISLARQGRHRYYALAGPEIAHLLETLMGVAQAMGHRPLRTGPNEPALRQARVCYDHLAGAYGVTLYETLGQRGFLEHASDGPALSPEGRKFCAGFGIDVDALRQSRRPLCRACLDWSMRRSHLAGSLGAAFLDRFYELGWARRRPQSRVVSFSAEGTRKFAEAFGRPFDAA